MLGLTSKTTAKQRIHFQLNSKFQVIKFEEKDLGVIISAKLYWRSNSLKRCKKASKAFYFLKRTVSVSANTRTKLNDYVIRICHTSNKLCLNGLVC